MRLNKKYVKRSRVLIRDIDEHGKHLKNSKSESITVYDCTAKELKSFVESKIEQLNTKLKE